MEFTKRFFPVPLRNLSVNSLLTISEVSSIIVIIESVIFSFVPLGITRFIEILSDAIEGKKEVLIIPPPNDPIVKENNPTNIEMTKKRFFNEKSRKGRYNLSLINFISLSPILLKSLSFLKTFEIKFFGIFSCFNKALECAK